MATQNVTLTPESDTNQTPEFSPKSYARTVHCADVLVGDVIEQKPNGTTVCAMRPAPRFCGKPLQPGDLVLIDPRRAPQTGDLVHVGEGPGFLGMPSLGGNRFRVFPCEESVLGVIVSHFPKASAIKAPIEPLRKSVPPVRCR
jgi:hypothetical protein